VAKHVAYKEKLEAESEEDDPVGQWATETLPAPTLLAVWQLPH